MSPNIKQHQRKNIIKDILNTPIYLKDIQGRMCFNFSQLDYNQSSTFLEWENDGILANAMETIKGFCCNAMPKYNNRTFAIYNNFPARSDFTYPRHVPEDATWARIHVDGTHILAGHIDNVNGVFYVVFLDTYHGFWITELNNT